KPYAHLCCQICVLLGQLELSQSEKGDADLPMDADTLGSLTTQLRQMQGQCAEVRLDSAVDRIKRTLDYIGKGGTIAEAQTELRVLRETIEDAIRQRNFVFV